MLIFKVFFALEIEFLKIELIDVTSTSCHKILQQIIEFYGSQVAHPCSTTFSYAILLASGRRDDLKFVMSGQSHKQIVNHRLGYCTTR